MRWITHLSHESVSLKNQINRHAVNINIYYILSVTALFRFGYYSAFLLYVWTSSIINFSYAATCTSNIIILNIKNSQYIIIL